MSGGSPDDRLVRSWVCRVVLRVIGRCGHGYVGWFSRRSIGVVRSWVCPMVVMAISW